MSMMENNVIQIELISAANLDALQQSVNLFLNEISADQYVDVKIGKGDFHTAMVIYKTRLSVALKRFGRRMEKDRYS